ncbi:PRC-barrel domain-containing protein [Actinoplanes solisilvae]|uniref:PRC-barrel domain-containing protein n=1 Tax=Actinoplanes solisilvae TaxID=2486853 RepID=UPI000FDCD5FF|nr:PRC-barrel domain-containing protein [Actinoplanes solisilvae]
MINQSDLQYINGADVYAAGGGKIGSAGQVYLDDRTGEPEWLSVRTGLAGTRESFVPLNRATLTDDRLEVPFDKDRVKNAPRVDTDGEIGPGEEDKLYTYYGLGSVHGYRATSETVRLRKYVVTSRQPPAPVRRPVVG